MIDRTNVGISPLISTPMTTSYVTSAPAQTTYQTIPQTTSYVQEAYPVTSYGGQVIDQTTAIPTTTYTAGTNDFTSFAPEITTPDQALTSFVPETTTNVVTSDVQAYPVTTYGTGIQTSTTTSVVPNVLLSQPQTTPQVNPQIQPILDEDFQRGRPIYDEFNEDRYRNFKFGN